jgi:hypothetical protein
MDQMEYLIANSFQQFQHERAVPAWRARIAEIESELARAASGASASTSDGAPGTMQLGAGTGVVCGLVTCTCTLYTKQPLLRRCFSGDCQGCLQGMCSHRRLAFPSVVS